MRSFLGLFAATAIWSAAPALSADNGRTAPSASRRPYLRVLPPIPRQGGVILVRLEASFPGAEATCDWLGKSYPCFPVASGARALLPVGLETRPGLHLLRVETQGRGGLPIVRQARVRIAPGSFGVQHLRLEAAQEALYSDPEVTREYRLIREAFAKSSPEQFWRGNFLRPVKGRVTTSFGLKRYVNRQLRYRHRGLDLSAPEGTPVLAANAGRVALAAEDFKLHGKTILLDHGQGVSTLYLHLSEIAVREGEEIARGQVIARVGATGVATGPHLHFGAYLHGAAVDPLFFGSLPAGAR